MTDLPNNWLTKPKGLSKVAPNILTKANPSSTWLLQARAEVTHQNILLNKGVEATADTLDKLWEGQHPEEAQSCAEYLVAEYEQLEEGVHLVDRQTGRVVLTLHDDDIYQPEMVERESGHKVLPLKRIRPDLEAYLYRTLHDAHREQLALNSLKRLDQERPRPIQQDYSIVTRGGRVEMLTRDLPSPLELIRGCRSYAPLLDCLELLVVKDLPLNLRTSAEVVPVKDLLSFNLQFNFFNHALQRVVTTWLESVVLGIQTTALEGKDAACAYLTVPEAEASASLVMLPCGPVSRSQVVFVSGLRNTLGFAKNAGTLHISSNYQLESYESESDIWVVRSEVGYKLELDPTKVSVLPLPVLQPQVV